MAAVGSTSCLGRCEAAAHRPAGGCAVAWCRRFRHLRGRHTKLLLANSPASCRRRWDHAHDAPPFVCPPRPSLPPSALARPALPSPPTVRVQSPARSTTRAPDRTLRRGADSQSTIHRLFASNARSRPPSRLVHVAAARARRLPQFSLLFFSIHSVKDTPSPVCISRSHTSFISIQAAVSRRQPAEHSLLSRPPSPPPLLSAPGRTSPRSSPAKWEGACRRGRCPATNALSPVCPCPTACRPDFRCHLCHHDRLTFAAPNASAR